ncbi:protein serine/threonine phosphatase 2C family protein [Candidatus Uhrbacteria bacterium]|nr:protein serine/threonine phosphatase 2C family protein [Candidatus Uhrbacteria bacterium]
MVVEFEAISVPLHPDLVNEDAFAVSDDGFFVALVDGHGTKWKSDGTKAKKDARIQLFSNAVATLLVEGFDANPYVQRLPALFDRVAKKVDAQFKPMIGEVDAEGQELQSVGAVVSCVSVTEDAIHLAHAGDCRLYASNDPGRGYRLLTMDHNGKNPSEVVRLAALDLDHRLRFQLDRRRKPRLHYRQSDGYWPGSIAVTRGFGNWQHYQPMLTHAPEVLQFALSDFEPGTIFALCTDGGNQIVQSLFVDMSSWDIGVPLQDVMREVVKRIKKRGQFDDVTILLFRVVPG